MTTSSGNIISLVEIYGERALEIAQKNLEDAVDKRTSLEHALEKAQENEAKHRLELSQIVGAFSVFMSEANQ